MKPAFSLRPLALAAAVCVAVAAPFGAMAADEQAEQLSISLSQKLGLTVESVSETPVAGLYEVVAEGRILYVSADGKYLINGHIYDVDNSFVDLTEQRQNGIRADILAQVQENQMVVFPAKKSKYVITVFTDVDCGYCQKLHDEMAGYNKLGITVRYMGYPRAGIGSSSYNKLQSVWCSDDKQEAMTLVKQRKEIPALSCDTSLPAQYDMGRQFGITGTPSIILEDGSLIGGYLPPERLIKVLDEKS